MVVVMVVVVVVLVRLSLFLIVFGCQQMVVQGRVYGFVFLNFRHAFELRDLQNQIRLESIAGYANFG